MSSPETFNFGRKIKELKKLHKKGYADLTAGLKLSRERIIRLEEGEAEPTEKERQLFAAFYNLPLEEFTPRPDQVAPAPAPRPAAAAPLGAATVRATPPAPTPRPPAPVSGQINRPPAPRPAAQPKAPKPQSDDDDDQIKDVSPSDPKPVMKYTAEQLGDIESAYLRKQRDLKVPLTFTFLNGKEFTGVVLDFTPFTVHIKDETTGEELILRKLAMAYYRKADALSEKGGQGGD
jgi:transcriptional regulator with XRE-family HTH domain